MLTELARRHLWSAPERTAADAEAFTARAHIRAVQVVRLFYVLSLVWLAQSMPRWPSLRETDVVSPKWPASWIDSVGTRGGITAILLLYALGTFAAVAMPRLRVARFAYFLGLLQYMALVNGFGKIGHGLHSWLWVSLFLVLLPSKREDWRPIATKARQQFFIQVVMLCQMVMLFFYTLTGLWKIYYGTLALLDSGISGFHLSGFSYIIGENLLATGRDTLLGDLLVERPVFGWALFNGTMYLEAMSLVILFRPRLHRAWGFGLIMFHVGTQAAMGILFPQNIALLGLLLLSSPIAPEEFDLRATVLDLPGVRFAHRQWCRYTSARRREPEPATAA